MAKTEGTQTIPAPWLDAYRATLGEQRPNLAVHKRYPWRLPTMQRGGSNVTAAQRIQRNRFLTVRDSFKATPPAQRARWYAAMPPWSSLLWYYNFFMLSGLNDVLGANPEGASVIKSIKHYIFTLPAAAPANITIAISTIDPAKAIGFLYGAGGLELTPDIGLAVYPFMVQMNTTTVIVKASLDNDQAAGCGISVVEYI